MMANSDYTYNQVLGGTGSFNKAGDTKFSQGVSDMQTYLKKIGYTITDTAGRFTGTTQGTTYAAVYEFQRELGISQDGDAGKNTLVRLDAVRTSTYYTDYGARLEDSAWGRANILAGKFGDVDLLARIIYGEHTSNTDDQKGVAIVIKQRSQISGYYDTTSKASMWARVVGMAGQYGTAAVGYTNSQKPTRGYAGQSPTYVDPGWKNAVDRAKDLVNGTAISVTGYAVNGKTVSSTRVNLSSSNSTKYLNQVAWSAYTNWVDTGHIDTSIQPVTFSSSSGGNVLCKYK